MNFKTTTPVLLFLIIVGCGISHDKQRNASIEIQYIKQMPDDIEGCACYLSTNDSTFNEGNHIFASNNDSKCYMMLNDELIRFKMKSASREPFVFINHDLIELYSSDKYDLTVKAHYEDSTSFESWNFNGEIIVKNKTGETNSINFVGVCGC